MPGKRKRTGRPAYKARYTSYRTNSIREKNKANRIVKSARSAKPVNIKKVAIAAAQQNKHAETTVKFVVKKLNQLGII